MFESYLNVILETALRSLLDDHKYFHEDFVSLVNDQCLYAMTNVKHL